MRAVHANSSSTSGAPNLMVAEVLLLLQLSRDRAETSCQSRAGGEVVHAYWREGVSKEAVRWLCRANGSYTVTVNSPWLGIKFWPVTVLGCFRYCCFPLVDRPLHPSPPDVLGCFLD
jgi:hypothetical protein